MNNILVCGLSYGDEGKGKITNYLSNECNGVVRYSGGPNAGHTVYVNDKKYVLHHLPSGVVKNKPVYLEPGMVLYLNSLEQEVKNFEPSLVNINNSAHIITEKHLQLDSEGGGVGSTKRGVGPCYTEKASRTGLRFKDACLHGSLLQTNRYDFKTFDSGYIFEGAQGVMLDPDYGHYPYVTSASVLPSSRYKIDRVIGVTKAYITRVGDGPPYRDPIPELSKLGKEFGSTTGRLRKSYWLDLDELGYAIKVSRCKEIAVTKLDILCEYGFFNYIKNGELRDAKSIGGFISVLREAFPIKYLSWGPEDDLEVLRG